MSEISTFIIDNNLRQIIIPDGMNVLGVAGDIEVKCVSFEMPRYYNGIDMSEFDIFVDYENAKGYRNYYKVVDTKTHSSTTPQSSDNIVFTWTLESDVTAHQGTVTFAIRMVKRNGTKIVKQFDTDKATGIVLDGMNVFQRIPLSDQKDILGKIETDAVENIQENLNNYTVEKKTELNVYTDDKKNVINEFTDSCKSAITALTGEETKAITDLATASKNEIDKTKTDALNDLSWKEPVDKNTAAIASLNEDLVQLKKDIKTNSSIFTGKILNENTYKSGIAETPIPSTTSTISDGIIIPVLKNDVANSDISEIFRYSVPMTIANDLFPKNKAVTSDLPVNLGYRVEFYFSGKSFEVMLFGYGYLSICVDDNCVMEHSVRMPNDGNVYYQKVIFSSEIKHKHISLYIDGVFRGIKTNGVIEKYNANRLKIIADGDSITESTPIINGGEAVINSWISKLSKVFDYDLSNVALGGTGYINNGTNRVNMVDRFDKNVAKYNPDILVSMGGLNDSYDDLSALEVAVNSYWNKVSNLQCKAICITPFNPQPSVMKISEVFLPILQKHVINMEFH